MMSRLYLFVFFLGIAVQFGDCENSGNNIDCTLSKPGSDKTNLSCLEGEVTKIVKEIQQFIHANESFSHFLQIIWDYVSKHNIPLIFPGTLWCGGGDIAKSEKDLGYFNDTDACCRAHDNCKSDIVSGNTKANLKNNGLFTRSACSCDHEFYNCLKSVNSPVSKGIGETYFNLLRPQCFQCICPSDGCQINNSDDYCNDQCTKYEWVNNKKFYLTKDSNLAKQKKILHIYNHAQEIFKM